MSGLSSESDLRTSSGGKAEEAACSEEPALEPVIMNDITSLARTGLPRARSLSATWTEGMDFALG